MSKYCTKCRAEVKEGAKFCNKCGNIIPEQTIPKETEKKPKDTSNVPQQNQQQIAQPSPQQPTQPQQIPATPMPVQQQTYVPVQQKKSNKKLIAIILTVVIVIVVVLLAVLLLMGDEGKFYGTWNVEYMTGSSNPDTKWTFSENGKMESIYGTNTPISSTYEIRGGRLCLSFDEYNYYHCYDYEFSNGGNTLTLAVKDITSIRLIKVS